jgi:hypothetical protein
MRFLILFACTLLSVGYVTGEDSHMSVIKPNGETTVLSTLGKSELSAVFETKTAEIEQNDKIPRFAQCTYSRMPCVLTSRIKLSINQREIPLPRSVFADLGDIHTASFSARKGLFVLTIHGGDASEAYIAEIIFNKDQLLARRLISAEDPYHSMEDTQYHQVNTAD